MVTIMLGRKNFTIDEMAAGQQAVAAQLAAFRSAGLQAGDFEATYFNGMTLALDRRYVHRVRVVAGSAGTPLNELELIAASLIDSGVLKQVSPIKYSADKSLLGIDVGQRIALTADQFETLAAAVFEELNDKFGA